jgi:hypothetical protein
MRIREFATMLLYIAAKASGKETDTVCPADASPKECKDIFDSGGSTHQRALTMDSGATVTRLQAYLRKPPETPGTNVPGGVEMRVKILEWDNKYLAMCACPNAIPAVRRQFVDQVLKHAQTLPPDQPLRLIDLTSGHMGQLYWQVRELLKEGHSTIEVTAIETGFPPDLCGTFSIDGHGSSFTPRGDCHTNLSVAPEQKAALKEQSASLRSFVEAMRDLCELQGATITLHTSQHAKNLPSSPLPSIVTVVDPGMVSWGPVGTWEQAHGALLLAGEYTLMAYNFADRTITPYTALFAQVRNNLGLRDPNPGETREQWSKAIKESAQKAFGPDPSFRVVVAPASNVDALLGEILKQQNKAKVFKLIDNQIMSS